MLLKKQELGFKITNEEFSWAVSIMCLGAALICIPTGLCLEKYGRKPTVFFFLIPTIVGWIVIGFAKNLAMLIFGRFLQGFAAGAYSLIIPIYIGEISENKVRGFLGCCFTLMVNLGILFGYFVGYSINFQSFCIICSLVPLCYGVIFMFMPETPVYLIGKKENEKAMQSLIWLRGKEYDCTPEFRDIQSQFEVIMPKTTWEALKEKITLRAMLVMISLMIFIQLGGIHVIIFYSTTIFFVRQTFMMFSVDIK
jgi:MFS family permease